MKIPKARKMTSGNYFIQLRIKQPDGSTRSISVTGATEKLCAAKAAAIKGGLIEEKNTAVETLSAAIDDYIRLRENVLSPSTIRGYRIIQKNRFCSYMSKPLSEFTSQTVQAMINVEAKLISAKTLKNSWGFISSVLHENTGKKYNPKLPQLIQNEEPFLDYEQIQIFLSAIRGDRFEMPALLALCSLRRSEILALTWDNVNIKHNVLAVCGASVPDEYNKLVDKAETKNQSSRRLVPIAIPRLVELLQAEPEKTGKVYKGYRESPRRRINQICAANGLPEVGLHGLRRSFASLCFHLRISELECMKIGGWSDWGTMRKIYTKLAEADKNEAMRKLTEFYSSSNDIRENAN